MLNAPAPEPLEPVEGLALKVETDEALPVDGLAESEPGPVEPVDGETLSEAAPADTPEGAGEDAEADVPVDGLVEKEFEIALPIEGDASSEKTDAGKAPVTTINIKETSQSTSICSLPLSRMKRNMLLKEKMAITILPNPYISSYLLTDFLLSKKK